MLYSHYLSFIFNGVSNISRSKLSISSLSLSFPISCVTKRSISCLYPSRLVWPLNNGSDVSSNDCLILLLILNLKTKKNFILLMYLSFFYFYFSVLHWKPKCRETRTIRLDWTYFGFYFIKWYWMKCTDINKSTIFIEYSYNTRSFTSWNIL